LKRWRLAEVLRRAVQVGVEPETLDTFAGAGVAEKSPGQEKKS
jgi:hypothetical protein